MAKIIKRIAKFKENVSLDRELDNMVKQTPHRDDVVYKADGTTKTLTFYGFSDSAHTTSATLKINIVNGQIKSFSIT